MIRSKLVVFLFGVLLGTHASAQTPGTDAALQLFAQYVALGQAYDPAVADLYADDALIRNKRSEMRQYSSPLGLLVGASAGGRWVIYEELSESRP